MAMKVTDKDVATLPEAAQRVFRSLTHPAFLRDVDILRDLSSAGHTMTAAQLQHYLRVLEDRGFATRRRVGTHTEARRAQLVACKPAPHVPPPEDGTEPGAQQLLTLLDDEISKIGEAIGKLEIALVDARRFTLNLVDAVQALQKAATETAPAAEVDALRRKARKWDSLQAALGEDE